ncbi:hypothetical protein [Paraburkholderia humisilvae]|uniref:Uncharacterized protein n=1 Tax=Paraburkholderia humisilvae TaxID=627669 RepID=A0A6J5EZN8_9BURK|nr:hypothetical protein [Paraburkholderia humisilvae]CAB3772058.1 hypothetical protein LMG29542_06783 [Paraburkholderia humisilvae]
MSNRHPIPLVAGDASVWRAAVGHTMILGAAGAGKTTCGLLHLALEKSRTVCGDPTGDARDTEDEACT